MLIRPANADDSVAIWSILGPTIRAGETYALDPAMREEDALAYWLGSDRETRLEQCRRNGCRTVLTKLLKYLNRDSTRKNVWC
jgi:hypothetical protein